jgi:hypothetical protein
MFMICPDPMRSAASASAGYRRRTVQCAARSAIRTAAPIVRPPSSATSTRSHGSPVTSTSRSGASTPRRIRSTRFVPPPRYIAPGVSSAAASAASTRRGRS